MIELQLIKEAKKEILYNIFQKYLYEMTNNHLFSNQKPDYVIAELSIFKNVEKKGIAKRSN